MKIRFMPNTLTYAPETLGPTDPSRFERVKAQINNGGHGAYTRLDVETEPQKN